jgi:hypothetical protein
MATALQTNSQTKNAPDKRERITGRLRHALDLMVWGDQNGRPLPYDEAARSVNITTRSMRKSLERTATRLYLREQREVFRACLTAKSLWRLDQLSIQDENRNAAVAALRVIEGQDEAQARSLNAESPHMTIQVVNVVAATPEPAPVIEHEPPRDSAGYLIDPATGERIFDPFRDRVG